MKNIEVGGVRLAVGGTEFDAAEVSFGGLGVLPAGGVPRPMSGQITVAGTCTDKGFDELLDAIQPAVAHAQVQINVPLKIPAQRRFTRSGRAIYGTWPGTEPRLWIDKADDKLERRRIRSRIAAFCRGRSEAIVIDGDVVRTVGDRTFEIVGRRPAEGHRIL